jgi:UDPglucose--hexose-1-phosphate uridylyltransferase
MFDAEKRKSLKTIIDPLTGRPILVAPERRLRPIHTAEGEAESPCPFCPGHETMTPPEVDAIRVPGSLRDAPGWIARAFPNLYPAATWHEVIAEGAEHRIQPAHLTEAVWREILDLYRRRVAAAEAHPGIGCAFLFKNVGFRAGASVAHNHSQIIGLPEPPPRLQLMHSRLAGADVCPIRDDAEAAEAEGRLVSAAGGYAVICPRAAKLPNEVWVLPLDTGEDFLAPRDPDSLARALRAAFAAIDAALNSPPFNMYLLRLPRSSFPWRFELQPRTGNLAGLELGGDMYINSMAPAESAALLRSGLPLG